MSMFDFLQWTRDLKSLVNKVLMDFLSNLKRVIKSLSMYAKASNETASGSDKQCGPHLKPQFNPSGQRINFE